MLRFLLIVLYLNITLCFGQHSISGYVVNPKGKPIVGVNVMIDNSYDGGITDGNGHFEFDTALNGSQLLVSSFIGFETLYTPVDTSSTDELKLMLRTSFSALDSVEVTAGSLKTSAENKNAVLTPMDIVTTAGAVGDVFGALQRLPGTSQNTSDGRLFVRGGQARESQIFIDGQRVFQPFLATVGNTPTRGRYSPFLFKGVSFSTGGYDAEFGQALSGIVDLNSNDLAEKDELNVSVMTLGGGLAATKAWKKRSITFNSNYFNLKPYQDLIRQRINFTKPAELFSGEVVYREQLKGGLFKTYVGGTYSNMGIFNRDLVNPDGELLENRNSNLYINSSYKGKLGKDWSIRTGAAISFDNTKFRLNDFISNTDIVDTHLKLMITKRFSNYIEWNVGGEQFLSSNDDSSAISAAWSQGTFRIGNHFISKLGMRYAHFKETNEHSLQPRASLAFKANENSQFSLAYGNFAQLPNINRPLNLYDISAERATHYVANYSFKRDKQLFRAEVFHKRYDDLIQFDSSNSFDSTIFSSNGFGNTSGAELFWRDQKSIKNLEYWVTYSYLDNKRLFQNYAESATPPFGAEHNFSLVTKYWVDKWKSQIGASWGMSSGRTFTNPNQPGFLNDKTKWTTGLDLNWAYLISPQKILFFSATNILGGNNIFGYRYANTPDTNNVFQREAIRPPADRFFLIGFFWTFSEDKSKNMLEQL